MLTRNATTSDIFFVVTGAVEVIKTISVLILISVVFPEQFSTLSVNMDIMHAVIAFTAPWVIAFLQLSKISRHSAYRHCAAALLTVGAVLAIVYVAVSFSVITESRQDLGLLGFLLLRVISVFALTLSSLNQACLMMLGRGRSVFWLQIGIWIGHIGLYLTLWLSGTGFSFVLAGLGMVAIDLALLFAGVWLLKKTANISAGPVKPSWKFSVRIRRIILPELSTVMSISLSGLVLSVVAFRISAESFADFRLPFAFQMACWLICARASVLIIRQCCAKAPDLRKHALLYAIKVTWFVPIALMIVATLMSGQLSTAQFNHSLMAIAYYPAMLIVIALNGVFRLTEMNSVISSANKWMLIVFFLPLAVLIDLGHINAITIIHFVGISYLIRVMLMMYLHKKRTSIQ